MNLIRNSLESEGGAEESPVRKDSRTGRKKKGEQASSRFMGSD